MIKALQVANREKTPRAVIGFIRKLLMSNKNTGASADGIAETAKVEYKPKNGKYSYYDNDIFMDYNSEDKNRVFLYGFVGVFNKRKPTWQKHQAEKLNSKSFCSSIKHHH